VPAVADQVDHHVLVEAVPVGHRQANCREARLGIVGIHVDDGDVESLGEIGGVAGGPGVFHIGRESNLVVGDEMQCPARAVSLQRAQVQGFGHHTLAGEGSVAVDRDRQCRRRIVVQLAAFPPGLLGPGPPVHDRGDELEVTRIG
jgi:hypothetical protein